MEIEETTPLQFSETFFFSTALVQIFLGSFQQFHPKDVVADHQVRQDTFHGETAGFGDEAYTRTGNQRCVDLLGGFTPFLAELAV